MADAKPASYEQFLKRYEDLKALYFSPKSDPQFDEDGEEIPSPYLTKAQIQERFAKDLRVHTPTHRQDPPKFFDGTVGPAYVSPRLQAPSARPLPQTPEILPPLHEQDLTEVRRPVVSIMPKPKLIHCGVHGKVLAIMMADEVLMCESCYKQSIASTSGPEEVGVYL